MLMWSYIKFKEINKWYQYNYVVSSNSSYIKGMKETSCEGIKNTKRDTKTCKITLSYQKWYFITPNLHIFVKHFISLLYTFYSIRRSSYPLQLMTSHIRPFALCISYSALWWLMDGCCYFILMWLWWRYIDYHYFFDALFIIYASIKYCRKNSASIHHLCIICGIHFGELNYFD